MDFTNLNLMEFVPKYLIIVIVAAYVLGNVLKTINSIKDKYITIILGIFCISFAIMLMIINSQYKIMLDTIVYGVLHGILAWGIAIGVNQTIKQLSKDE